MAGRRRGETPGAPTSSSQRYSVSKHSQKGEPQESAAASKDHSGTQKASSLLIHLRSLRVSLCVLLFPLRAMEFGVPPQAGVRPSAMLRPHLVRGACKGHCLSTELRATNGQEAAASGGNRGSDGGRHNQTAEKGDCDARVANRTAHTRSNFSAGAAL